MTIFSEAFTTSRAARRPRPTRTPVLVLLGRLLVVLGAFLGRRLPDWAQIRTAVLTVGGLGLLTTAAWMWSMPVGIAAAGVSLLVVEMLAGADR